MQSWIVRATSRYSLVAALVLGGLAFTGMAVWFVVESAAARVNATVELSAQLQEALDSALGAQVHFKMQVQEWKDILLRGEDGAAYQRHVENFESESQKTQTRLLELRLVLEHLGLPSAAASEALATHERVLRRYHEALTVYNHGGRASSRAADAMVAAIDREPMRQIGVIVAYVRGESANLLDIQRRATFDRTHAAKQALVGLIGSALLAALLLLFVYSRERIHDGYRGAGVSAGNWAVAGALVLAVVALAVLVGRTTGSALAAAESVAHPHEMRAQLEQLKAQLTEADDAARDFVIENNPDMEREFEAASQGVRERIAGIRKIPDPGVSAGEIEHLDAALGKALSVDEAMVRSRRESGAEIARRMLDNGGSGALRDAIGEIDRFLGRQGSLLTLREASLNGEVSLLHWTLMASGALVLLMLVVVGLLLLRDQRQRRMAQDQLQSENRRLDEAVRERTASLAHAKSELERLSRRSLQRQEQERHQLSRELDNEISHQLAALLMNLQRIVRTLSMSADAALIADLQQSIHAAKVTYREICELAVDLRPAMLDQLGLVATLQWFAREVPKPETCSVTVNARPLPEEPAGEAATAVYRIVQEAVHNALQHAAARHIVVDLSARAGRLELRVTDDGKGFETAGKALEEISMGGLGLLAMRQRAAAVGADLSLVSAKDGGTQLLLSLPLAQSARAAEA